MKILYVTHKMPINLKYGGGLRNTAIFEYLSKYYQVYLLIVPFIEDTKPGEYYAKYEKLLPVKGLFVFDSKKGYININHQIYTLDKLIDLINPDVMWVFEKWAIRTIGFPKDIPTILDIVDVQWHKHFRILKHIPGIDKAITGGKLIRSIFEDNYFASKSSRVLIANEFENKYLFAKEKVIHLANGFNFPDELQLSTTINNKLIFFGLLNYYPNIDGIDWFCKKVWPLIINQIPQAIINIIGDFSTLGGRIDHLREIPGVNFLGFVNELDPWIADSSALIVPLRIAGGTRIKILEAWSKGLPVVSTSIGCEGLDTHPGETILIADDPQEFADSCIYLMENPDIRERIAHRAYENGKNTYDWNTILSGIPGILEDIL